MTDLSKTQSDLVQGIFFKLLIHSVWYLTSKYQVSPCFRCHSASVALCVLIVVNIKGRRTFITIEKKREIAAPVWVTNVTTASVSLFDDCAIVQDMALYRLIMLKYHHIRYVSRRQQQSLYVTYVIISKIVYLKK